MACHSRYKLRALILGALLALVTSRANARLWETIPQTEARYGRALKAFPGDAPGEEERKYRYKDFYVLVTFLYGRSDDEWYFHTDGKTPFSGREIQFFLSMTSGGTPWQKSSDVSDVWSLGGSNVENWKAVAAYYPKLPRSTIPGLGMYILARGKKLIKLL
jgi:hypothetical protein